MLKMVVITAMIIVFLEPHLKKKFLKQTSCRCNYNTSMCQTIVLSFELKFRNELLTPYMSPSLSFSFITVDFGIGPFNAAK